MTLIYNIGIRFYFAVLFFYSLFNLKARRWIKGRKNIFNELKDKIGNDKNIIWVHCASLGEFEQGRSVIEAIKKKQPDQKILLTFFSPSGFETRKNYSHANYVCYLPLDSKKNASGFFNIVKPVKVYFIKYEFWYHYLKILHQNKVPIFLVSGIFRDSQLFFKWYGRWFRKMLYCFTSFFVQNSYSADLLKKIGLPNSYVTGDTRFDRVYQLSSHPVPLPVIERFKDNKNVFVAGSTWQKDEEILVRYINNYNNNNWKFILAPHEINNENIEKLLTDLSKKTILYSEANNKNLSEYEVLIIDNIGMLSSIYRYGTLSYIGGGFGKGIHNILEPVTFGTPVVFGPKYQKFREATELIKSGVAFTIKDAKMFDDLMTVLINNNQLIRDIRIISSDYIKKNIGATEKILAYSGL